MKTSGPQSIMIFDKYTIFHCGLNTRPTAGLDYLLGKMMI